MSSLEAYIFSVIVCSVSCKIVSKIISDPKRKALIRLICGIVLAISILQPLTSINLENIMYIPTEDFDGLNHYIVAGERAAEDAQARSIIDSCEAYILNKSTILGTNISVQISLNENMIPAFAEITGEIEPHKQMQLQEILSSDLGIPKENQKWIRNPESNSS